MNVALDCAACCDCPQPEVECEATETSAAACGVFEDGQYWTYYETACDSPYSECQEKTITITLPLTCEEGEGGGVIPCCADCTGGCLTSITTIVPWPVDDGYSDTLLYGQREPPADDNAGYTEIVLVSTGDDVVGTTLATRTGSGCSVAATTYTGSTVTQTWTQTDWYAVNDGGLSSQTIITTLAWTRTSAFLGTLVTTTVSTAWDTDGDISAGPTTTGPTTTYNVSIHPSVGFGFGWFTADDTTEEAEAPYPDCATEAVYRTDPFTDQMLLDQANYNSTGWTGVYGSSCAPAEFEYSEDGHSLSIVWVRYRFYFPVPSAGAGRYWLIHDTLTIGADGAAVSSVEVFKRGVYRPAVSVSGDGSGAVLVAVMDSAGGVDSVRVLNPGSGYTSATVTVGAAINGGATSTGWSATISGGKITAVTGGSDGDYLPALEFSDEGTTQASGTCTLDPQGGISAVTVTLAGAAYPVPPTVEITAKTAGTTAALLDVICENAGDEEGHMGTRSCVEWVGVVPEDYDPEDDATWPRVNAGANPSGPARGGTAHLVNVHGICRGGCP